MTDESNVKSMYWARKAKEARDAAKASDAATAKDVPIAAELTPDQVSAIVEEAFKRKKAKDDKAKRQRDKDNIDLARREKLSKPKPKGP